ncbi:MAG TPA: hypothetical protein VF064_19480, partial [Pyrinomonadaceae bacterium]
LVETAWEGLAAGGRYTVEFLPEGKLRYTLVDNKKTTGGSWKQTGDFIQMSVGGYSALSGRIEGDVIRGEGSNVAGEKWSWALTRKEK